MADKTSSANDKKHQMKSAKLSFPFMYISIQELYKIICIQTVLDQQSNDMARLL